ncbi:MAG: hypothetical protein KGJ80_05040 [Chloroflexota bacterium]|nr:hypothetical protein [Chloroflexota bacterium]
MPRKQRKPAWFILYMLVFLMPVSLVLLGSDGLPAWANEIAGIVIVLLVFAVMAFWVHANTSAILEQESSDTGLEELRIDIYPPIKPPSDDGDNDPDIPVSKFLAPDFGFHTERTN